MQHSQLEFSKAIDRPVAIAGLEERLIQAFQTAGGFGVFQSYLGRSLLWCRDPSVARLRRIEIVPEERQRRIPSWSWMAYHGGIKFLEPPFDDVDWTKGTEFQSPYTASSGRVSSSRNIQRIDLRVIPRSFEVGNGSQNSSITHLVWDEPDAPRDQLKCVVIGRRKSERGSATQTHWVLIIRPVSAGSYERVGVGSLPMDARSQVGGKMESSVF